MITISLRMDKKRVAALLLALGLIGAGAGKSREKLVRQVMQSSSISARKVNPAAANEQQRRDFMAAYGWEVQEEPLEIREVLIPGQFDEAYEKYNYIQKQQGFDLSRYRGKVCRRYVYALPGYPGGAEEVRITLLVYKDRVIGGDISSPSADGFMHGFDASSSVWLGLEQLA